jgi:hypothetical protein
LVDFEDAIGAANQHASIGHADRAFGPLQSALDELDCRSSSDDARDGCSGETSRWRSCRTTATTATTTLGGLTLTLSLSTTTATLLRERGGAAQHDQRGDAQLPHRRTILEWHVVSFLD